MSISNFFAFVKSELKKAMARAEESVQPAGRSQNYVKVQEKGK